MGDDVVDGAEDESAAWVEAWWDTRDYEAMGAPELAQAYLEFVVDGIGDRAGRLRAEANAGAHSEVFERLQHDPDPITLIDAIVRCAPPVEVVWVLGAGVMEEFLRWRPELWEQVEERCSGSSVWAQMVSGVWLDGAVREKMPARLRALIPSVSVSEPVEESRRSHRAREKAERKARTRKRPYR